MMRLFTAGALLLSFLVTSTAFAATVPLLNTVSYQTTEQQWIKTSKATAIIAVNATVSDQNVATLRESILSNLQEIAVGNWHITQFNRSKTSSGLESVTVLAQIRLPSGQLDHIYKRVKMLSKAGKTYTVSALNFTPDPEDITMAQAKLRQKIYGDVQNELNSLNKQFSNKHYFVHQIRFMSSGPMMPRALSLVRVSGNVTTPSVSQRVTLTAQVELSSKVASSSNANG